MCNFLLETLAWYFFFGDCLLPVGFPSSFLLCRGGAGVVVFFWVLRCLPFWARSTLHPHWKEKLILFLVCLFCQLVQDCCFYNYINVTVTMMNYSQFFEGSWGFFWYKKFQVIKLELRMSSFPGEHKSPVDLGYGNFGYASILYIKKAFYTCLSPPPPRPFLLVLVLFLNWKFSSFCLINKNKTKVHPL